MAIEPLLVEVIGGSKVVLDLDPSQSVEAIADAAARAVDRSLTEEDGSAKAWRLFAPTGKGGFAPAKADANLSKVATRMRKVRSAGGEAGFAGPGQHEGKDYLFRLRLFVPSLPPPKPVEEAVDLDDEEAIDLTNLDAEADGLQTVRRVEMKPRRKRRKSGPPTETGRHKTVGTSTGRRKRQTGELPEQATATGRNKKRRRSTGELPRQRRKRPTSPGSDGRAAGEGGPSTDDLSPPPATDEVSGATEPVPTPEPEQTPPPVEPEVPEPPTDDAAEEAPEVPAEETPQPEPESEPAKEPPTPPEPAPEEGQVAAVAPVDEDEDELDEGGDEHTHVMSKEAVAALAEATASAPAVQPTTPAKPPQTDSIGAGAPAEAVSKTRVVTRALDAASPERGAGAVTNPTPMESMRSTGRRSTGGRTGGRTGGMKKTGSLGRSTGTLRRTGPPDGSKRTGSGHSRKKKKKKKNSGLLGLIGALVLLAVAVVLFVLVTLPPAEEPLEETDNDAPTAAEAPERRLSDEIELEPWPHDGDPDVAAAVRRLGGLASGGPAGLSSADQLPAVEALAQDLADRCGEGVSYDACEASSVASFAAYQGCRGSESCDDARTRALFIRSIQSGDHALARLKELPDDDAKADGLRRLTVQSVRLAGQSMEGLRGVSPQLATLAQKACEGGLAATPDCADALKP